MPAAGVRLELTLIHPASRRSSASPAPMTSFIGSTGVMIGSAAEHAPGVPFANIGERCSEVSGREDAGDGNGLIMGGDVGQLHHADIRVWNARPLRLQSVEPA